MANEHHAAVKVIDGVSQRVDGLDIQVIGGLVQEQHVGVLPRQPGKAHPTLLPIRQVLDWTDLEVNDEVNTLLKDMSSVSGLSTVLPAVCQSGRSGR